MKIPRVDLAAEYAPPLEGVCVEQAIVVLLSLLILDGGGIAQICLIALLAFWGGVAVMVLRRPRTPTRVDLVWIAIGYPLLLPLTWFLTDAIWRWRGV